MSGDELMGAYGVACDDECDIVFVSNHMRDVLVANWLGCFTVYVAKKHSLASMSWTERLQENVYARISAL